MERRVLEMVGGGEVDEDGSIGAGFENSRLVAGRGRQNGSVAEEVSGLGYIVEAPHSPLDFHDTRCVNGASRDENCWGCWLPTSLETNRHEGRILGSHDYDPGNSHCHDVLAQDTGHP